MMDACDVDRAADIRIGERAIRPAAAAGVVGFFTILALLFVRFEDTTPNPFGAIHFMKDTSRRPVFC